MVLCKNDSNTYEIVRLCSKLNYKIMNSESILLNHFIVNYKPYKITTSTNNEWYGYDTIKSLGFKKIGITDPYMYYFDYARKFSPKVEDDINYLYNKRKDKLLSINENQSKLELISQMGYNEIYDSGHTLWEMVL